MECQSVMDRIPDGVVAVVAVVWLFLRFFEYYTTKNKTE